MHNDLESNRVQVLPHSRPAIPVTQRSGVYAGREDDVEEAAIGGATAAAAEEDMYGERERERQTDGQIERNDRVGRKLTTN